MLKRITREMLYGERPKAKVIRIDSVTPERAHAWCDSDQGRIRKPIGALSKDLIEEYRGRVGSGMI